MPLRAIGLELAVAPAKAVLGPEEAATVTASSAIQRGAVSMVGEAHPVGEIVLRDPAIPRSRN